MRLQHLLDRIRAHPRFSEVGMVLTHVGVVRASSKDGRPVAGFDLFVDRAKIDHIISEQKKRPGIVEILVAIREGRLSVGDEVMHLVVAGRVREEVIPVLADTLDAVKKEATRKKEHFL